MHTTEEKNATAQVGRVVDVGEADGEEVRREVKSSSVANQCLTPPKESSWEQKLSQSCSSKLEILLEPILNPFN